MEQLLSSADVPEQEDLLDDIEAPAVPLGDGVEPQRVEAGVVESVQAVETSRALALTDVTPPRSSAGETLIRMAYRFGVPGHVLAAPFRRASATRVRATVSSPLEGDRAAGIALRAGHFLVNGVKTPIGQIDFDSNARHPSALERTLHGFSWLANLAASAPRQDCTALSERITGLWLDANPDPGKGPAWSVEHAGRRLLAWLTYAPLVLSGEDKTLRGRVLDAIEETAAWLDRKSLRAGAGFAQVAGWAGVTAAGLLLPEGRPRRLYGEAALIRALGDLVGEDGGVLSRCPETQIDAIAVLTDLIACYEAVEEEPPRALQVMRELMVPPLLTLRHGDGGLGSWQGQNAIGSDRVSRLIAGTGIRTRALKDVQDWGFQRLRSKETIVQFDAAPPPRSRHTRCGCASTLAFELSDGPSRVIVNCGGAVTSGGLVPARIALGLRATAAHSTLVLDNANSTAVLLHGKLGKGAELVETETRTIARKSRQVARVEASHDGYAARFGLLHRRVLTLSDDGGELGGEDVLVPVSRKGKRGKIAFCMRFHLGRGVEAHLSDDKRGASLLTPDGRLWQFRLGSDAPGADEIKLTCEDSMWIDAEGRPHAIEQLVVGGLTSRGGGQFSWLLKKMG